MDNEIDPWLTRRQVQAALSIGMTKYFELIGSRRLPSFKDGQRRVVRKSDLIKFQAEVERLSEKEAA